MGYVRGEKWDLEKIKSRTLEVVEAHDLKRMPSSSEVQNYYKDSALSNAIKRHIGWYKLAEELNLPIKDSETYFGKKQEELAKENLISLGYEVRRMSQNFPYDLFLNDCVKIDVKASKLYRGKNGNFYTFNLEKPYATCDIYLLYLVNDNNSILDVLVIPSKFVSTITQISVGATKSKYYKFSQRWDYIELYDDFMSSVG